MSTGQRSVELVPIIVFLLLRILLLPSLLVVNPSAPGASAFQVAKTNCKDNCGDVTIPYPFGIGTGCFLDEWYEVVCLQQENNTSVPRLKKIGLDVLNISLPNSYGYGSWIRVNYPIYYSSPNCTNDAGVGRPIAPPSLSGSNFVFAQGQNKFTAVGCDDVAFMESPSSAPIGCKIECSEGSSVSQFNDCSGSGCCQFAVPSDVQAFNISFQRLEGATASGDGCSYAFVVDTDWFKPGSTDLYSLRNAEHVPVSLGWGISSNTSSWGNSTLAGNNHVCRINSYGIMQCYCADGFTGNSYLGADGHGCQDINECEDPTLNRCPGKCENMKGSYKCVDGSRAVKLAMMVIGGFVGALLFLFSARWLHRTIKRRKKKKLKQKFFKQNGGLLLQQQLASPKGNVEKSKLFNSKELDKATDNFNENRILGQGGQGVTIKLWDLGGQRRFRTMWERYCRGVSAILCVVDAADRDSVPISRSELHELLTKPSLSGIPLLVLGNKIDKSEALSKQSLVDQLGLESIKDREVCCYMISCKDSINIDIVIDWLIKHSRTVK